MRLSQDQFDCWESLQAEYDEAKKEFDEAAIDLEKVRCEKEAYLTQLLFGIQ